MSGVKPFVSVIIPVFNDAERLRICLTALEQQTYPRSLYEVIVVDNGSTKGHNISELVSQFNQAKAAYETIFGSYAARNKGIALATGDVFAFTDADCIPAVNWLENGVKTLLEQPDCGLVAGEVAVFFKDFAHPTAVELYERIYAFPQKTFIEKHRFGVTANIFTFRDVIYRVGLFDASLKSGGDVDWGQRVFSLGYPQIYADNVCVAHPALFSWRQLYKKHLRIAGGKFDVQQKKYASNSTYYYLFFILRLVLELLSPPVVAVSTFSDSRLRGFKQKFKVSCLVILIIYVRSWEKLRLITGGASARE